MADKKISALTAASTPLAGTEVLPIVQSSTTVKVSVSNLTDGRSIKFSSANVGPNYLSISGAIIDAGKDQNSPTRFGISNQNTGASAVAGIDLEAAGGGWQIDVPADVVTFVNPLIGKFGGTEKFRFTSDGNYVPKVAAKGVNFTANTAAAGMTSQLLNWYEEGTFTPTFDSTGGVTYTDQLGWYTRIGNLVTVTVYIRTSALTTNASDVTIGSLPFAISSSAGFYPVGSVFPERGFNSANATDGYQCIGIQGTSTIKIYGVKSGTGANTTNVIYTDLQATDNRVRINLTYRV